MSQKRIGFGCSILGLFGVLLSIFVDFLPGANPGIQAAQILGIEISAAIILAGIWMLYSTSVENVEFMPQIRRLGVQILDLPIIVWVLAGFLASFILFFISPMFFNQEHRIQYFHSYLPDRFPAGSDLVGLVNLLKAWFFEHQSPYQVMEVAYPPLTFILFSPYLLIGNYPTLYLFVVFFSLTCYTFLTFVLPIRILGERSLPVSLLFFLTGVASYGLQFELERGQYNVLAFLLCLLSIYIFHYHPKQRLIAYLLFSLSVQLKIYPAIFILLLVEDWKAWKSNLLRFAAIGGFNLLLLFVMGAQVFLDFMSVIAGLIDNPGLGWIGNHSIEAFVDNMARDGFNLLSPRALAAWNANSDLIAKGILMCFLVSLVITVWISHRRGTDKIDPYLLLTCMIGALIIPVSNDYTLSILAAPIILFFGHLPETRNMRYGWIAIPIIFGIALAYSSILLPYKYKPHFLTSTFPALFLILILATVLNIVNYKLSVSNDSTEKTT